ncbi:putative NAD synthetase [Histomonas meleagridis]|uniref:putative NAD synthetase n=1 Tax=Histomonas meleagridis TaxID=135588 RepID=UPI00355A5957|nr:putative NAD synthetase [Histomonas meleagridis]KAH0799731.1 putative NAD synthetase [Histomonas meleagridis]
MLPQLQAKLQEIRASRNFNASQWVQQKCALFNEYMKRSGLKGCVVNCSGGIDSAVTLVLAKKAMEMEGSPITKVLAILQPIHSTASIQNRGRDLCEALGIDYVTVDQTAVFDLLHPIVDQALGIKEAPAFATGQLRSYMRTPVAYYICQLLGSQKIPSIVLGTGNYDEDGYLYYFCKAGDGTSDVQLIHDLHKSEVRAVAKEIGVIDSIIVAPPSADLWEGQTDEDELGFPYDFAELYIELLNKKEDCENWVKTLDAENLEQWNKWKETIDRVHRRNSHKEVWPLNLDLICPNGIKFQFK